jgi:hypothetical protein
MCIGQHHHLHATILADAGRGPGTGQLARSVLIQQSGPASCNMHT